MWATVAKRLLEFIIGLFSASSARPASDSSPSTPSRGTTPSPKRDGLSLVLTRKDRTEKATIGELYVDGVFECYTLEDRDRLAQGLPKIPGQTAIPSGAYSVVLTQSPRFGRVLPLLQNIPNFEGVRIHPGNKPEDTDGCILVGRICGPDQIAESRLAFDALFAKLEQAVSEGRAISISIS